MRASRTPNPLTRTALRQELRRLSRRFAEDLFDTLERFGIWDELARRERELRAASARSQRVRRSDDALQQIGAKVLAALRAEKEPAAISVIAARLGSSPRRIAHPLALLVAEGRVVKTGERRGTRYALAPRRFRRVAARARTRPRAKRTR